MYAIHQNVTCLHFWNEKRTAIPLKSVISSARVSALVSRTSCLHPLCVAKTLVGHPDHRKVRLTMAGAVMGQHCSADPHRHKLHRGMSRALWTKHDRSTATAAPSLHQKERGTHLSWRAEAQTLLGHLSSLCHAPIAVAVSRACIRQLSYTATESNTLDTGLT